jgi:hypothetical protein
MYIFLIYFIKNLYNFFNLQFFFSECGLIYNLYVHFKEMRSQNNLIFREGGYQLFFKVFFIHEYIKIIYFLFFKNYF